MKFHLILLAVCTIAFFPSARSFRSAESGSNIPHIIQGTETKKTAIIILFYSNPSSSFKQH
jgi:hypothetical protein